MTTWQSKFEKLQWARAVGTMGAWIHDGFHTRHSVAHDVQEGAIQGAEHHDEHNPNFLYGRDHRVLRSLGLHHAQISTQKSKSLVEMGLFYNFSGDITYGRVTDYVILLESGTSPRR